MARRFVRVDVTGALNELRKVGENADIALQDMQMEIATMGRDKMRQLIETRGTGKPWTKPMRAKERGPIGSLRSGSSPGRVNTGRMRDAVRVRFERGEKQVRSAFGWIDAPADGEKYFRAQEYGMPEGIRQGFRKSVDIPGMFALRDARLYVVSQLPRLTQKYRKRLQAGRY